MRRYITAGQGALCRKTLKYTGGTGPTSLNLSQAVGVLAYELFMVRRCKLNR